MLNAGCRIVFTPYPTWSARQVGVYADRPGARKPRERTFEVYGRAIQ